jgi:tetratricopeptide (TPR) repeat protein
LAGFLLPATLLAEPFTLRAEFWNSDEFQRAFARSYAPHGEVEPKISASESDLFRSLIEVIQQDPSRAAAMLAPQVKADSSAAFDFTLGNLYFQTGDTAQATRWYKKAVEKFPDFRRAYINLGLLQVREGDFGGGIRSLAKAIQLGAIEGNTYGLLGYCYLQVRNPVAAESAYRKAILYSPENIDWRLGLAQSLLSQRRHAEAAGLFGELLDQDPGNAEYWLFQANAYIALDEPALAAANFEMYHRLGAGSPETLNTLGDIYLREGNQEMALETYLTSVETGPNQPVSRLLNPTRILIQRRDFDRAGILLAKVEASLDSARQEERLQVLRIRSELALTRGLEKEAVEVLEQIVSLDPLDGEALILLGRASGRQGRVEQAELAFENAAGLAEHEAEAKLQHGQLLVSLQRYREAVPLLRRAQQLRPRENVESYLEQVERLARISPS